MNGPITPLVIGDSGLRGRITSAPPDGAAPNAPVVVEMEDGQVLHVPRNVLVRQQDGSYYLPLDPGRVPQAQPTSEHVNRADAALVVPVYQEEFSVEKRTTEIGSARITKRVEERQEVVDEPLLKQEVQIEHVPINRLWEGPPPPPRYEADKLVVPLLEEVLVVEKRLMLKEELHISRVQKTVHEPQTVVLRRENVTVERVDPPHSSEPAPNVSPHGTAATPRQGL
jgi:stress response protein YsnF